MLALLAAPKGFCVQAQFSRVVLPGLVFAALLAGCQTTPPEEEPAYVKATAVEARTATVEGRAQAIEGRVAVVERQAQALLELQRQLDAQAAEQRALRGELEQLQELARKGSEEQRNLYADIDRRLTALEARPAAAMGSAGNEAGASGAGSAGASAANGGSAEEAYQAALAKLRAKDYAGATAALAAFAKRYPESALRDNAAYWLGEAHYVDGHYSEALEAFQAVVTQFPDSRKRADALLKAGYCQVELRQWAGARKSLRRVVSEVPGTPAAKEAAARLATFDGSKAR